MDESPQLNLRILIIAITLFIYWIDFLANVHKFKFKPDVVLSQLPLS